MSILLRASSMRRSQHGFSLLEMIAALTILAIGSVVLFSWLGQTTNHLGRFQDQEKQSLARLQAVQFLSTQNPALKPEGKQSFTNFSLEWKSELVRETRDAVSPAGGLGLHEIGLYQLQVTAYDNTGRLWFRFPVRLVGYRQVREPTKGSPF